MDPARSARSRALRAVALVVASFAALALAVVAAGAAHGDFRLLPEIAGFVAYVLLFGRAVREFDLDRKVWDHPDSGLLNRLSGKSPFAGHRS